MKADFYLLTYETLETRVLPEVSTYALTSDNTNITIQIAVKIYDFMFILKILICYYLFNDFVLNCLFNETVCGFVIFKKYLYILKYNLDIGYSF